MKIVFLFMIATVLIISCSEAQNKNEKSELISVVEVIDAKTFNKKLENPSVQIVDVRTPDEFAAGSIAGAINIDYYASDFSEKISELNKQTETLIYCHSGGRSGKASKILKELGFTEVYDLKGGFSNWPF
ncbi:MAG: rhodanese-like domain-containing protein [Flavobacteriales bacterium]|nr:rhodanese-like domain-containing protein [Flavobacteriales bacterium]